MQLVKMFTNLGGRLEANINISSHIEVYNLAYNKQACNKAVRLSEVFMKERYCTYSNATHDTSNVY